MTRRNQLLRRPRAPDQQRRDATRAGERKEDPAFRDNVASSSFLQHNLELPEKLLAKLGAVHERAVTGYGCDAAAYCTNPTYLETGRIRWSRLGHSLTR